MPHMIVKRKKGKELVVWIKEKSLTISGFWNTQKEELEWGFGDAWYPFKWQKSSDLTKIAALGASAAAATGAAAYLYKREKR